MSKFNHGVVKTAVTSPIRTEALPSGRTFEGGPGFARDARSELFLLAVSNMVGEETFYEKAAGRDSRYVELVHQVAVADPAWMAGFLPWLRVGGNMRSASLVGALEAARAMVAAGMPGSRQLVDAALQRADEPGEAAGYWLGRYGRTMPKPVKRGIADAVRRLYRERSLLKYDSDGDPIRFGDVIDLTHPVARDAVQGYLFQHALDRRHKRDNPIPESLAVLRARAELMALPVEERRTMLDLERLNAAGMTWEALAGWLQGPMDAAAWEAVVPSMGVFALTRNLRNFDQAGVSDTVAAGVAARLADPAEVAKSRMLPMRFLSAYRAAPSLRWSYPLEQALGHSLNNIPALGGRTLVLVDTSSSMNESFSTDGKVKRWDAAATFGVALGQRCAAADVVSFSSTARSWGDSHGAYTKVFPLARGESLLRSLDRWMQGGWFLGGGTATAAAVRKHFAGHDRIVIVTDEQAGGDGDVSSALPPMVPLYSWNLAGYKLGHGSGGPHRHTFGGLTDAAFGMIQMLEWGSNGRWPWEVAARPGR